MIEVTDQNVLSQLNGSPQEVTDPAILAQLNGAPAMRSAETPLNMDARFLTSVVNPMAGIAQDVGRAGQYVTSLGGSHPNPVSDYFERGANTADNVAQASADLYKTARSNAGIGDTWSNPQDYDMLHLAGNLLSPANLVTSAGGAAMPAASSMMAKILQGSAVGAGIGAEQPVANINPNDSFASQKEKQVGAGAVMGGVIPTIGGSIAGAISPNVSDNAQTLLDNGVRLTPGQIMGGAAHKAEDALTSVPLLGDAIKSAQFRGVQDMNKAAANAALAPIGKSVPDDITAGHDLVNHVSTELSNAYNNIIPKLTGQADSQFNSEIANLKNMASNMPDQQANQFNKIVDAQVMSKIGNNGIISGQSLKEMESQLGNYAKGYMGDSNFDQRNLGNALSEVQASLRSMIGRSNPQYADELQNINEGYANYTRLRAAAASTGAGKNEGVFTPAQLNNAVRNGDNSVGKGQYAKGQALMQDLSGAAQNVLPSTVPDSGSIGRALTAGAVLGHFSPAALGGAVAGSSIYSKPGIALAQALLTKRPDLAKPIAGAIGTISSPSDIAKFMAQKLLTFH